MTLDENYQLIVIRPHSRKEIEALAVRWREMLGISECCLWVDVLRVLEIEMPRIFGEECYTLRICEMWQAGELCPAYYDSGKNEICIRADVYDRARKGDGWARFTIMHEIMHFLLFKELGMPYPIHLEEIAKFSDPTLKSMDTEWQADVCTGEIMCRTELVKSMEMNEIEEKCGVTPAAAKTAYYVARGIPYSLVYDTADSQDGTEE